MRVLFAIWGFFGFLTLASNGPAEACAVDKVEQVPSGNWQRLKRTPK